MPGERNLVRRVPGENFAPVNLRALGIQFVPAAADAWLDKQRNKGRLADVVRCRPPCFHLFDKD
jgi:hypothetical protein